MATKFQQYIVLLTANISSPYTGIPRMEVRAFGPHGKDYADALAGKMLREGAGTVNVFPLESGAFWTGKQ